MTQQEIDRLVALRNATREEREQHTKKIETLTNEYTKLNLTCDHKNPDGSSAWERRGDLDEYDLCKICKVGVYVRDDSD